MWPKLRDTRLRLEIWPPKLGQCRGLSLRSQKPFPVAYRENQAPRTAVLTAGDFRLFTRINTLPICLGNNQSLMRKHAKHVPVPRSFEEAATQDQQRRKRETNTVCEKQKSSRSKDSVFVFSVITCSKQQGGLRAQGTCVVPPMPDMVSALLLLQVIGCLIFHRKHAWSKEALGQEATF